MRTFKGSAIGLLTLATLLGLSGGSAWAQRPLQTKEQAVLVVDGVVREVFRSTRRNQVDYVVQIDVQRPEAGRTPREPVRVLLPAPGDDIYVHVFQPLPEAQRGSIGEGHRNLPPERAQVRVFLYPRSQGGWEGAFPDWFDLTNRNPAPRSPDDPEPAADTEPAPGGVASTKSILERLGITADTVPVGDRIALRVNQVNPDGPSKKAGIEPGDVIVAASGAAVSSLDQLTNTARQAGSPLKLTVLDVRSGKTSEVAVDLGAGALADSRPSPNPGPPPSNPPQPVPGRVLGVKTELTDVDGQTALKVTDLMPGSPAQKAGIERGDVIVSANGTPVTKLEQLTAAVQQSGPVLTLLVRDQRTGRRVPVEVNLAGSPSAPDRPSPTPAPDNAPRGTSARALGVAIESTSVNLVPAVKVTQVAPGSPAQKAGIETGDVITAVNDTVIISTDQFQEVIGKTTGELTLTVVDVRTGKKTPVKVNMGR